MGFIGLRGLMGIFELIGLRGSIELRVEGNLAVSLG